MATWLYSITEKKKSKRSSNVLYANFFCPQTQKARPAASRTPRVASGGPARAASPPSCARTTPPSCTSYTDVSSKCLFVSLACLGGALRAFTIHIVVQRSFWKALQSSSIFGFKRFKGQGFSFFHLLTTKKNRASSTIEGENLRASFIKELIPRIISCKNYLERSYSLPQYCVSGNSKARLLRKRVHRPWSYWAQAAEFCIYLLQLRQCKNLMFRWVYF